ncbi:uncharacterized protein LOC126981913 isoform X3 [Eriocheir sinensis]|uniref:uncharacterized protein LOC126981913 isoform X3 n=1 Tax=Eriocheir sinensis TaxID=95602 RepID=UPI0021C68C65|nr:uncharacterized protein LOC126981913 isoform X3 [Eriocheir sinensis]
MSAHINKKLKRDPEEDVLSWEDYFMAVAFLTSKRSKDPSTQVGACIVNAKNRIMGIGYNGMPNGWPDDLAHWGKDKRQKEMDKHTYVCHAELNAIVNKYTEIDLSDCRIFQTRYPCSECTKLIIQSGIKEIHYLYAVNNDDEKVAGLLLQEAGMKVNLYKPKQKKIHLLDGKTDGGSSPKSKRTKREDYLRWERYFMAMAALTARRSPDPNTKVGSCIVMPDNRIVGLGYNYLLSADKELWHKRGGTKKETKYPYVCHAAVSAYMFGMTRDVTGSTLYTTLFPTNECIKVLIQAGIKRIVYASEDYKQPEADTESNEPLNEFELRKAGAKKMLDVVRVKYRYGARLLLTKYQQQQHHYHHHQGCLGYENDPLVPALKHEG